MTIYTGDQHKKYSLMQYFVGFIFLYKFCRIYCLLYTQSTSQLGQTSCVCHSLVLLRNKMGTMMYVKGKFIRLAHIIWSRYSTMALSCTWEELRTQWLLSSWEPSLLYWRIAASRESYWSSGHLGNLKLSANIRIGRQEQYNPSRWTCQQEWKQTGKNLPSSFSFFWTATRAYIQGEFAISNNLIKKILHRSSQQSAF